MIRLAPLFGFALALPCLGQAPIAGLSPEPALQQGPNAEQIRAMMRHVYGHCQSYQDDGVVSLTDFGGVVDAEESTRHFATAFLRTGEFKFALGFGDSLDPKDLDLLVKREGAKVRAWRLGEGEAQSMASLPLELWRATGASFASATRIPELLIHGEFVANLDPEGSWMMRFRRDPFEGFQRVADGATASRPCFRLQHLVDLSGEHEPPELKKKGIPGLKAREILWVDQKTFLVLRDELWIENGVHRGREVTTYMPCMDLPIPASAFIWNPPR